MFYVLSIISMTRLQQDVRHYVRVARKTKGQLKKFDEFNMAYKTELPTYVDMEGPMKDKISMNKLFCVSVCCER